MNTEESTLETKPQSAVESAALLGVWLANAEVYVAATSLEEATHWAKHTYYGAEAGEPEMMAADDHGWFDDIDAPWDAEPDSTMIEQARAVQKATPFQVGIHRDYA